MKYFLKAGPNWSGFLLSAVFVSAFALCSCQTTAVDSKPVEKKVSRKTGPTRSFIGLTKNEAISKARAMGLRSRVVRDDFERFLITKDMRDDRINFEVDKGVVTSAKLF